jgi:hypothetical protein
MPLVQSLPPRGCYISRENASSTPLNIMLTESWSQILRRPRYEVAPGLGLRAQVQRGAEESSGPLEAELLNLSRHGFQLRMTVPLVMGESVALRLSVEKGNLDATLPGTVQWQSPDGGETWLVGCQTTRAIAWETLGELFLNGILIMDR